MQWYARVQRQPSWVTRAALLTAGLVILVPLAVLAIAAALAAVVVFTVLGAVLSFYWAVRRGVGRLLGTSAATAPTRPRDRRVNVRVIEDR